MTNTPTFHLRSESDFGPPTNTSGSPRPKLRLNLPWLTYHYSGVPVAQVAYSQNGAFADDSTVAHHMANLERVARNAGKPYEYNAVIPAMLDPQAAHVWAYADEYQAAHSAGENADAYGVQFPNGIGQPLTPGQIRAFVWWHAVMEAAGRLAPNHQVTPHHDMPGAATICPGPAIDAQRPLLLAKWEPDTTTPEGDNEMKRYKDNRYSNEWLIPEGTNLSGQLAASYSAVELIADTHDQALAALILGSWPTVGLEALRTSPGRPGDIIAKAAELGYLV